MDDAIASAVDHLTTLLATQAAARIVARSFFYWRTEYERAQATVRDTEDAASDFANALYRIFDEATCTAICDQAENDVRQLAQALSDAAFDANPANPQKGDNSTHTR